MVRVFLLGGFRVELGARALDAAALRLRAAQQLIKLLALAPEYQLHREQVLDILWPDQPVAAAVNSLNQTLFVARRALAAPPSTPRATFLSLRDQRVRLGDPQSIWVDAIVFEATAQQARERRDPAAARAALPLYRGDLLPEDPYDTWLDARRVALRQRYRGLLLDFAAWAADTDDIATVRDALQRALEADPADEELHRAVMLLAARAGDRQAAIRQFQLLERALRHDLGLAPDARSQQLYHDILSGRAPADQSLQQPAMQARFVGEAEHPLPAARLPVPLTSFVGRAGELAALRGLLATTRLLTIAGAGGSGKTRLALEVARAEASSYPDGARFVGLAALADPALLVSAVASALGVRERQGVPLRDQLIAALSQRRLLLVLDNCEHLVDAVAQLAAELLAGCPGLRVLVTSREPLRIGGELTWLIPALGLPDPCQPPPALAAIAQYPALQLFVERARAAQSQFALREQEVGALVQICARLDGLPLAIELAAARVPVLSIAQIADRLDDRFGLLTGGNRAAPTRQQTLRAAIDWSYDLLADPERTLLRRLAVFAGGWNLEAAEAVCADKLLPTTDVLPLLAQLVDKSLVQARDHLGARRYELLETMRQYALEILEAAGEVAALRDRHQTWALMLAAQGEAELTGPRQVEWLGHLAAELDNLRAALQWAVSDDADGWVRLAYRLYWFWYLHSAVGEGRAAFERALAQTAPADRSWKRGIALLGAGSMALYEGELATARRRLEASLPILRASEDRFSRALAPFMAGTVAVNQGDYVAAREWLDESLPVFEALGHRQGVATALLHLGDVALGQSNADGAEARYAECLAIHRADTGSTWGMAQALNNLGEVARCRGDLPGARRYYHEALALFERLATKADVARTRHNLAAVALAEGDAAAAEAGYRASLALFREWGNCRGMVECVAGLAAVRAAQSSDTGERIVAATMVAFVGAYFAQSGAALWPPDRQSTERTRALLASQLNADQLADATSRGQSLTLTQALTLALEAAV